ncbi:hypothetical protein BJ878DRAFT_560315 [Calycina marina]|uniref:Uncharacterized protein n=1 Tax=Calycina marina TaxID=1763456 RepID=A0A9P7Z770_9HELO|nr:hypothetical protein BJ878DRAFT_560315 [Calycina marina]
MYWPLATFIALIIHTIQNSLQTVEIYIVLLLCFGGYLYLVPLYIWRLLTGCNPRFDPTRWSRVRKSKFFNFVNFWMLIAVTSFQLWFWFDRVPKLPSESVCQSYRFLFFKIRLNSKIFVTLNLVLQFLLVIYCVSILVLWSSKSLGYWKERIHARPRKSQRIALDKLRTFNNAIVSAAVIAATELTIQWNSITGVNDLTLAGQLIPFLIGVAFVLRIVYVGFFKYEGGSYGQTWHLPPKSKDPKDITGFVRYRMPGSPQRRASTHRRSSHAPSVEEIIVLEEPDRAERRSGSRSHE